MARKYWLAKLLSLFSQSINQFSETFLERCNAFALKFLRDVFHINTDNLQRLPNIVGLFNIEINRSGNSAMISECIDCGVRQRIYRVGPDELINVQRVGIVGILSAGLCPQWTLHFCTHFGERIPTRSRESRLKRFVR